MDKCPVSGKTIFDHKRDAKAFINVRKDGPPLRAYPCPDCNGWHVTKRVEKDRPVPRELLNRPLKFFHAFKKYLNSE